MKKVNQFKVIEEVATQAPSTAAMQELGPQFLCELTISTYRFKNNFSQLCQKSYKEEKPYSRYTNLNNFNFWIYKIDPIWRAFVSAG